MIPDINSQFCCLVYIMGDRLSPRHYIGIKPSYDFKKPTDEEIASGTLHRDEEGMLEYRRFIEGEHSRRRRRIRTRDRLPPQDRERVKEIVRGYLRRTTHDAAWREQLQDMSLTESIDDIISRLRNMYSDE